MKWSSPERDHEDPAASSWWPPAWLVRWAHRPTTELEIFVLITVFVIALNLVLVVVFYQFNGHLTWHLWLASLLATITFHYYRYARKTAPKGTDDGKTSTGE